jgi:hypothetical protein
MTQQSNPQSGFQQAQWQPRPSAVILAGGSAVVLGSLMPFVSVSSIGLGVTPPAKATSVVFGLIVVALAITMRRAAQEHARRSASVAALCLSGLGALGYTAFIAVGIIGWPVQDSLGNSYTVTFSPNLGILLAVAGCVAASCAAVRALKHREA